MVLLAIEGLMWGRKLGECPRLCGEKNRREGTADNTSCLLFTCAMRQPCSQNDKGWGLRAWEGSRQNRSRVEEMQRKDKCASTSHKDSSTQSGARSRSRLCCRSSPNVEHFATTVRNGTEADKMCDMRTSFMLWNGAGFINAMQQLH